MSKRKHLPDWANENFWSSKYPPVELNSSGKDLKVCDHVKIRGKRRKKGDSFWSLRCMVIVCEKCGPLKVDYWEKS